MRCRCTRPPPCCGKDLSNSQVQAWNERVREDESGDGKDDELVAVKETGARAAGKVCQKVISAKSGS